MTEYTLIMKIILISDENFLENAWQTAIKDEFVNTDDRSRYSIQVIEDETLYHDAKLSDEKNQQKENERLSGAHDD